MTELDLSGNQLEESPLPVAEENPLVLNKIVASNNPWVLPDAAVEDPNNFITHIARFIYKSCLM